MGRRACVSWIPDIVIRPEVFSGLQVLSASAGKTARDINSRWLSYVSCNCVVRLRCYIVAVFLRRYFASNI